MSKRRFEITITQQAIIELDQTVIDAVDNEWRSALYPLYTPEEIAEMIGRCMILFNCPLSKLDGWADQPDEFARIIEVLDEVAEAREITE